MVPAAANGFISAPGPPPPLPPAITASPPPAALLPRHGAESLRRAEPFLPEAVTASLASLYRSL